MELQPGKNFTIVRQLGLPGDVATYYVQAVVKNSSSGAVITTVNLTDNGSQRFTGSFQVPADTSGQGMNIDITTTVYTDSGYTTQSNIYTIDNASYLVFDRLLPRNVAVGAFNGDSTDYKRIKKMIDDAIATIPKAPEMPEMKETDLSPLLSSVDMLKNTIAGVVEQVVRPLNGKIQGVQDLLNEKMMELSSVIQSRAEFKETDLSEVVSLVNSARDEITGEIASTKDEIKEVVESSKEEIIGKVDEQIGGVQDFDAVANKFVEDIQKIRESKSKFTRKGKKEEPTPTPMDYLEEANSILKD